jgi:hypothetical protein
LGQQPAFVEESIENNEIPDKKNVGLVIVPKGNPMMMPKLSIELLE